MEVKNMEFEAYCLGLRKKVKIADPKLVLMKNGRYSVKGVAAEDKNYKVSRILKQSEVDWAKSNLPKG